MSKIYVKNIKKQPTIREFLILLFTGEGIITTNSKFPTTYSDKECTQIQCTANRMRSFDDLLDLVETYYPSITPKRLIDLILTLSFEKTHEGIKRILKPQFSYCGGMRKIRILYMNDTYGNSHMSNFSIICNLNQFNSKYSWEDLFLMLDIKSQKEFDEYIKKHRQLVVLK